MSETIEALLSRTRQLEQENALLRALQPSAQATSLANPKDPNPSEAPLSKPRDLSPWDSPRRDLTVRDSATPAAPPEAPVSTATEVLVPRTLQEFRALPADRRAAAALAMTRRQRDELLGRCPAGSEGYL